MSTHTHTEYSHVDGQLVCACGAVRLAPGKWADEKTSQRLRKAAKRQTARLMAKHGTAVDAYGQRLMSKYLISAENPSTGETSEFAVRAENEQDARDNANLADGWQIVDLYEIAGE